MLNHHPVSKDGFPVLRKCSDSVKILKPRRNDSLFSDTAAGNHYWRNVQRKHVANLFYIVHLACLQFITVAQCCSSWSTLLLLMRFRTNFLLLGNVWKWTQRALRSIYLNAKITRGDFIWLVRRLWVFTGLCTVLTSTISISQVRKKRTYVKPKGSNNNKPFKITTQDLRRGGSPTYLGNFLLILT